MKKISFQRDEEKKKKRNQWIVGGVLIILMVLSTLGYAFVGNDNSGNSNNLNYNGFEFINQGSYWTLNEGNFNFAFKYNPKETEIYNYNKYEIKKINNYQGFPLYTNSESTESEIELDINLRPFVLRKQEACLNESIMEKCREGLPIKTCEDNFIIIRESNESKILQQGNCVFIEGSLDNLTKVTDEFLFNILGIK